MSKATSILLVAMFAVVIANAAVKATANLAFQNANTEQSNGAY